MKIGIIGATGLIGGRIMQQAREAGHWIAGYSRRADRDIEQADETRSIRRLETPDFNGLDALIVAAGTSVFGWWTSGRKEAIRESRIGLMQRVHAALLETKEPPKVVVSASAVGFYGDRGETVLDESAKPGSGFLAETCLDWEAESRRIEELGIRVVLPRVGFVIAPNGPAHDLLKLGFGWGLGGRLGDGLQWMPWVHLEDVASQFLFACEKEALAGPFNATAPNPVTNLEFTRAMGEVLKRPTLIPAPAPLLKAGLGEMADELLLASTRAVPSRLEEAGYNFHHPRLESALRAAFR